MNNLISDNNKDYIISEIDKIAKSKMNSNFAEKILNDIDNHVENNINIPKNMNKIGRAHV